jgi:glycerophosphoryl diester phosphodiesterase
MASYPMTVSASVFVDVPVLCGHRGSGRGAGENTLPSFRAAVAAGLSWVEVDARVTSDGVLVACHEAAVADGRYVSELGGAQTDELGLMRVADLLEDLPPEIGVDVDVKTSLEDALRPRDRTTGALAAELVERERGRRPLLVTSFDAAAVTILRERLPDVPVGLLTWSRFPLRKAIPAAVHLGVQVIAPHVESFGLRQDAPRLGERSIADAVSVAHAAGLQVVAWCPLPAEREILIAAGVDCLVVDDVV